MRALINATALLVGALGLAACGTEQGSTSPGGAEQAASPAAEYCVERGGEYLAATGECRIGDGMVVDAEAFYQAHAGQDAAE